MALHKLLRNGRTDPGTGKFLLRVQAIENLEIALIVLRLNPDVDVRKRDYPFPVPTFADAGHLISSGPAATSAK